MIDGIPCYSVEHAHGLKDTRIIIAQKIYVSAYAQLKNMGVNHVALKDEVDAELLNFEPYRIEGWEDF